METIKKIFKICQGPSSSHTVGPRRAAEQYKAKYPDAKKYRVTLYGSLAATGVGHLTDKAILESLAPTPCELLWQPEIFLPFHPNGMTFETENDEGGYSNAWTIYSVGGGELRNEGSQAEPFEYIYEYNTLAEIDEWCKRTGKSYWEYVLEREEEDIADYLMAVWDSMQQTIRNGLEAEGVLPGGLGIQRKAASYYIKALGNKDSMRSRALVYAYSLATAEENACGGQIVTAPTCGSSGVLPAVLFHVKRNNELSDKKILRALMTAGLFSNVVKENASISGAEVGCQGEVGTACAVAAAAANQLYGGTIAQIEYAAEMGLEHHLGLTCDPVCGLVQIPCIERNAFAALRALDASHYSLLSDGKHIITFDKVVKTMKQTGKDLPSLYKETSEGGLALHI